MRVSKYYWRRVKATVEIAGLLAACLMVALLNVDVMQMPRPGINPELQDYVDKFETYAKYYYGQDFTLPEMDIDIGPIVNFASSPGAMVVGWCIRSPRPKIMINELIMWSFSDSDLEQLMFHELGHCVLDRGHRDTITPLMIPVSLMSSRMMDTYTYEKYRDYYIHELFTYQSYDKQDLSNSKFFGFFSCRHKKEILKWN